MPKPSKVLLVEDDPLIVRLYGRKLIKDGFYFTSAGNGEEGLAALKKNRPDIVLLDIMMPKMNGIEALTRIKADPQYKDLPVVVMTNLGDRVEDAEGCKQLGAEDYWVKVNVPLNDITTRINKILTKH